MKKIFITIVSIIFCLKGISQDMNFSQFYELPMLRNPSLAGGYKGDFRATASHRSQWASVTTPYVSQAVGLEMKFAAGQNSDNYFSLGLQLTNDVAGDSKMGRTQVLPVVAFHKSLSEDNDTYLSLGFMGGVVQNRFDPTKLQFDDQFVNGSFNTSNATQQVFNNTNLTYFDGSVGMVFSSSYNETIKYYLGGAYFHFNKPKVSYNKLLNDIKLPSKVMINAGLTGEIGENNEIIAYADYFTQGGGEQMQAGLLYKHDLVRIEEDAISLYAGSFLRWNDAVIPVIKLDYYKLSVGFTYDVNISKLKSASQSRGGFEISLSYRNYLNIRNSSLGQTHCPRNIF